MHTLYAHPCPCRCRSVKCAGQNKLAWDGFLKKAAIKGQAGEQIQVVTFQLGKEYYGIDILHVKEIHGVEAIRSMPKTPDYIEGILKLRKEVIPIINLHKRFGIEPVELSEEDKLLSGFIILTIGKVLVGIIIEKVQRVVQYYKFELSTPPQLNSGISGEYIDGVIHENNHYIIILNVVSLFSKDEFMKHIVGPVA